MEPKDHLPLLFAALAADSAKRQTEFEANAKAQGLVKVTKLLPVRRRDPKTGIITQTMAMAETWVKPDAPANPPGPPATVTGASVNNAASPAASHVAIANNI